MMLNTGRDVGSGCSLPIQPHACLWDTLSSSILHPELGSAESWELTLPHLFSAGSAEVRTGIQAQDTRADRRPVPQMLADIHLLCASLGL